MEAHIPAPNIRVFARALHTLSRIGDVLIVETAPDRLLIRALSQAQSSYAQISFASSFFTHYHITPSTAADDPLLGELSHRTRPPSTFSASPSFTNGTPSPPIAAPQPHKVIVNSKACLTPFRGAVSAIKRLTISLAAEDERGYGELSAQRNDLTQRQQSQQPAGSLRGKRKRGDDGIGGEFIRRSGDFEMEKDLCLMVQLHLDDVGVTKTYRIPTTEQTNILQPDFSRQSCPTVLSAKASKFQSWLTNFQNESASSAHTTLLSAKLHSMTLTSGRHSVCPIAVWTS